MKTWCRYASLPLRSVSAAPATDILPAQDFGPVNPNNKQLNELKEHFGPLLAPDSPHSKVQLARIHGLAISGGESPDILKNSCQRRVEEHADRLLMRDHAAVCIDGIWWSSPLISLRPTQGF